MKLIDNNLHSPIEHFEASYLSAWVDSKYNAVALEIISLYIFLILLFFALVYIQLRNISVFKQSKGFALFEAVYLFILNDIIKLQISSVRAYKYLPILMTVFITIFILNITSLFSYTTSVTGQLIITFSFAFILFLGITTIAFLIHKDKFIQYFVPKDVPIYLKFFLIVIEILSFAIRPFSLSIRLFANMLAGHTSLNIFGSFTYFVSTIFSFSFLISFILCLLIITLEIGVALIQAYVFVILVAIYINDITQISH